MVGEDTLWRFAVLGIFLFCCLFLFDFCLLKHDVQIPNSHVTESDSGKKFCCVNKTQDLPHTVFVLLFLYVLFSSLGIFEHLLAVLVVTE